MTATVAVRLGGEDDRPFVLDLGRRVAESSISGLRPVPAALVQVAFGRLAAYVFGNRHHLLVATDGSTRCGFLLLVTDMPDEVTLTEQAFVAYMAVEPDRRRRGVGLALLAAAEELACAEGLGYVSLMVTEDNAAARGLYERFGMSSERRLMTKALR